MDRIIVLLVSVVVSSMALSQDVQKVADLSFKLGALGIETYYYAFDEGDIVTFNFNEQKGKGIKAVTFSKYGGTSLFSKYKVAEFEKEITITERSVYVLTIENELGGRICDLIVQRKNISGSNLSTTVKWIEEVDTTWSSRTEDYLDTVIYKSVPLHQKQDFYINSATNVGGQTRTYLPINLPKNTVSWFYTLSCSRKESEIEQVKNRMNLAGEIASLISTPMVGGVASITASMISQPPGANQCDIFLMDHSNLTPFINKSWDGFSYITEGTRQNFKSGVVKISNAKSPNMYLGLRNEDMMHGIHVALEVVAIVREDVYKTREVKSYRLETRKYPVVNNQP